MRVKQIGKHLQLLDAEFVSNKSRLSAVISYMYSYFLLVKRGETILFQIG